MLRVFHVEQDEKLEDFESGLYEVLDLGRRVLLENVLKRLVDIRFGEAQHDKSTRSLLHSLVAGRNKELLLNLTLPFHDLVLQFKYEPLSTLDPKPLDALETVYVLRQDGLVELIRSKCRQDHPGRGGAHTGDAGDEAEQLPFVLGGKAVVYEGSVPGVWHMLDIDSRLCLSLQG